MFARRRAHVGRSPTRFEFEDASRSRGNHTAWQITVASPTMKEPMHDPWTSPFPPARARAGIGPKSNIKSCRLSVFTLHVGERGPGARAPTSIRTATKEIAMRQQHSLCPTLILAAVLVLPVCASAQIGAPAPGAVPADAVPGHFAEAWDTSTFEVTAIDAPKRLITLREEGQEPELYSVNKDVRNLDQVKVGDRVKVNQYMATSIKVLPKGELGEGEGAAIERSKPGERPGGIATRTRIRVERVSSIFPNTLEFLTR